MPYRVLYTATVRSDIGAQIQYLKIRQVSHDIIEAWFHRLFDLIDSLYESPLRFPTADPESLAHGFEIRKAPFEDYLIFYRVNEADHIVEVLSFQHGARRANP